MRVLVTGASGFVGRALTDNLATSHIATRAAARDPARITASSGIEPAHLPDLASNVTWTALLDQVTAVVHLAGIAHAGPGLAEDLYEHINHRATATLAAACAEKHIPLVFISSIRAQTGPAADHVLTETDIARPTDAYGRSKLAAEDAVRRSGTPFTILRPVVMYGPGVKGNLAALLRLAASPLPLPFAAFDNKRSLLAVDNLVSAIRHGLAPPAMPNETYIVADSEPISLADMLTTMRQACGRKAGLLPVPPVLFSGVLRIAQRHDLWERIGGALVADPAKLRATGWTPPIATRAGLAAMAQAASSPRKSGTASRSTP
jgi:nucleoside-diphosphate-sugar epimerase